MVWQVEWLILWEMIVKMLTHIHMMVYMWWCWHIYKGDEVGVDVDQLSEEKEAKQVIRSDRTLRSTATERWLASSVMCS